jgi:hypothetical protein
MRTMLPPRRVGKIVCRIGDAWAKAPRDFAHAQKPSIAPLPTLRERRQLQGLLSRISSAVSSPLMAKSL